MRRGSSWREGQGPGLEEEQAQGSWSRKGRGLEGSHQGGGRGGGRARAPGPGGGGGGGGSPQGGGLGKEGVQGPGPLSVWPMRQEPWAWSRAGTAQAGVFQGHGRAMGTRPGQRQWPDRKPLHQSRHDGDDGAGVRNQRAEKIPDVGLREGRANGSGGCHSRITNHYWFLKLHTLSGVLSVALG